MQRAIDSQQAAAAIQMRQLGQQTAMEKQNEIRRTEQVIGRLRVARGEASGLSLGSGSTNALIRQATFDAGSNLDILDRNLANNYAAVQSGTEAQLIQTAAMRQSPILAAFNAALGSASTGLSIAGGIQQQQYLKEQQARIQ
jgi:hypothetical protein